MFLTTNLLSNMLNRDKSFLFSLLGVLLALARRSLIGSLLLLSLLLSLKRSFLLLHDLLVLLNGFSVHLDGGVAEAAVVSIPVLCHESARSARRTGLPRLAYNSFACVICKLPSTE